jgi:TolA-binding protein
MPGNDAGVTPSEVYERSNKASDLLSKVWNVSTSVIKAITEVTDSSLRSEPDYQAVQQVKREHDQLVASLKSELEWLEQHVPRLNYTDSASGEKQMRIDALQQEQEELRAV